eukprot:5623924-Lingulodinium_polyedra.AAC.1
MWAAGSASCMMGEWCAGSGSCTRACRWECVRAGSDSCTIGTCVGSDSCMDTSAGSGSCVGHGM